MGGLEQPLAGVDFPGSLGDVRAWFPDDEACLDYLAWLRWGDYGFACHLCGDLDGWQSAKFCWECAGCKARISPTAGTIFHRTRLVVVPDSSAQPFEAVLREHVEPTATVATDAWEAWEKATKAAGYAHDRTNVSKSGKKAHEVLPAVSRVASQLKRWLGGTLQGAVIPEHLQAYCHEFEFRFNRRRSRHRGQLFYRLLSQAVQTPPTGYADLVRIGGAKKPRPVPPVQRRVSSATLAQPDAGRPWRR